MHYQNVCLESFGYTVPESIVTSDQIEQRLEPLYRRLKLPEGRLELMTGIRQRRFWPPGTSIGDISVMSCQSALAVAEFDPGQVGLLVHGSVCRDFLEPATACRVHHHLHLPKACVIYDLSNACLGILNGMLQAANMIELEQIKAALVVGTENGRSLVEGTINHLNREAGLTRKSIKQSIASLTIGSASCAVLLVHRSLSRAGNRIESAAVLANTAHSDLCESVQDQAGDTMQPLMDTHSESLMLEGIATGQENFERFLALSGWSRDQIQHTVCHQVGGKHRNLMLESIGMDPGQDFVTFPELGNTGSAALPITLAKAAEAQRLQKNDRIAMLGIGSGINSVMIGAQWQSNLVAGREIDHVRQAVT